MNFTVVNKGLSVGNIRIIDVRASSVFLIGDANEVNCSSAYDTPPGSFTLGTEMKPVVPLAETSEEET